MPPVKIKKYITPTSQDSAYSYNYQTSLLKYYNNSDNGFEFQKTSKDMDENNFIQESLKNKRKFQILSPKNSILPVDTRYDYYSKKNNKYISFYGNDLVNLKPDFMLSPQEKIERYGVPKGNYFTRPIQSQELGNKVDTFDSKTGKKYIPKLINGGELQDTVTNYSDYKNIKKEFINKEMDFWKDKQANPNSNIKYPKSTVYDYRKDFQNKLVQEKKLDPKYADGTSNEEFIKAYDKSINFPLYNKGEKELKKLYNIGQLNATKKDTTDYLTALNMLNKYGNPNLKVFNTRAYYNSQDNSINTDNKKDLISEISHSKQYNNDGWQDGKKFPKHVQLINDSLDKLRTSPKEFRKYYDSVMYHTPGTVEYNAHEEIEPKLQEEFKNTTFKLQKSYPFDKNNRYIGKSFKPKDWSKENSYFKNGGEVKLKNGAVIDKTMPVEVEGQELKLKNSHGDQVIIPKDKAQWIKDLIKNKSYSEIDKYVSTLPLMSDYAADGTLFPAVKVKDKNDPRIQAYQDSSKLYNNYIKAKKLVLNTDVNSWESFNNLRDKAESLNPSSSPVSNPLYKGEKRFGKPETYYPKNKIINGYETVLHNYEKPVQPYIVDEFKDEDFKKVLKNKTNNNRIGIDSKLIKNNKTVLYPEKIPVKYVPKSDMIRIDGTEKGNGFLGNIKNGDKHSSELSISVGDIEKGKDVLIPTMVPTLTQEELDHLISNKYNPKSRTGIDDVISRKAIDFARDRKSKNLPYFANKDEEGKFKIEQVSLIDSSQIKFPGSFSREIMPQEKGYDATKSKTIRYDRKGRIIKN